jgi:hypothetical protein
MPLKPPDGFRVYWTGEHPKPKRVFHPGTFTKRQQARQFCRNRSWWPGLTIVHPDGTHESYTPAPAAHLQPR